MAVSPCSKRIKDRFPRIARVLADGAYAGRLVDLWNRGRRRPSLCSISSGTKGTVRLFRSAWRWIVERTFAWLGNYRRLARDYEISPRTKNFSIWWAELD